MLKGGYCLYSIGSYIEVKALKLFASGDIPNVSDKSELKPISM